MQCDTNLAYEKCTIAFHSSAELFFPPTTLSKWFHHIAQLSLDDERRGKKFLSGSCKKNCLVLLSLIEKAYCFMCVYGTLSSFIHRNPQKKVEKTTRMRRRKYSFIITTWWKWKEIRAYKDFIFWVFFLLLLVLFDFVLCKY